MKYLADGPWHQIERIINTGICSRLIEIIATGCTSNVVGALLVCINISSGTSGQTQILIDGGIIEVLSNLLDTSKDNQVLKNAAFLISNITADTQQKIQSLIEAKVFQKLAKIFKYCDSATQMEILQAINNATLNGSSEQVIQIDSVVFGEILGRSLTFNKPEALKLSLDAVWNIATVQASSSQALTSITEGNHRCIKLVKVYSIYVITYVHLAVNSSIKKLQDHEDETISSLAKSLAILL